MISTIAENHSRILYRAVGTCFIFEVFDGVLGESNRGGSQRTARTTRTEHIRTSLLILQMVLYNTVL